MGYTQVTIGPLDKSGPSTRFYAVAEVISQNQASNYSVIRLHVICYNGPNGDGSSYSGGSGGHSCSIDAWGISAVHEGNPFLPSGYGQNQLRWDDWNDNVVYHDANGNLGPMTVRMGLAHSGWNENHYGTLYVDRILRVPSKPPRADFLEADTTSIDYLFYNSASNGGSPETGWDHQSATNAAFTQNLQTWVDYGSPGVATGLIPGTQHYIRYRSVNAVGFSEWSDPLVQTTLPAVPPGLTVAASPSGTQATLTFTPPGGVTGVTKYTWERRVTGTTTPVATGDSTGTVTTVPDLLPGTRYDWRASAWIGTYQSPWSTWQALTQPQPNTNPGDYFDGATPDGADLDYAWAGTANASISTATAQVPEGWEATYATGGAGVLLRVTAGLFEEFAARVQMTKDATVAGCRFGQKAGPPSWSSVTAGALYAGSIYAKLSRSNRVAAEITWFTDAWAFVSRINGTPSAVTAGAWTRLSVIATAPPTATRAVVTLVDVTGTGWSVFRGGDVIDLDGAMISLEELFPYFDGDTLFDGSYVYEWEGTPNASESTRTPLDQVDMDAMVFGASAKPFGSTRSLIDPDCAVVPVPPRPPTIPSDCIDEVGLWRRYYLQIPAAEISDWMDVVPTIEITTGASAARQVRIRYYENPGSLPPEEVDVSQWISEQIISYMPAATTLTLDGIQQRAYAEVGTADAISADHLLYGTGGRPATWPVLSCGIAYLVSLEVPTGEPVGNITLGAALTVRT